MLIRLVKSNHSAQLILLIVLAIALWARNFVIDTPSGTAESHTFLYNVLFGWTSTYVKLAKIAAFLCILLQAFLLTEIVKKHSLSKNPIFVGLIYVVLMSANSEWQNMTPALISIFFIIGGYSYLFRICDQKEPYEYVFNASALFATAALFSANLLLLGITSFLFFLYYPINKWREWVIALLGFGFPFLIMFLWSMLDNQADVFAEFVIPEINFEGFKDFKETSLFVLIFKLFVLLFSLFCIVFLRLHAKENEISQRKKIGTMMIGVCWMSVLLLGQLYRNIDFTPLFVFFAFFIAEWFCRSELRWLPEIGFFVLLGLSFCALYF